MAAPGKVVYVELVAQTKKFAAGMKKADAGLARVRKAATLTGAAIGAIAAVALRQVAREMDEVIQRWDDLDKAVAKTGLSLNALQDLEFLGGRAGAKGGLNALIKGFIQLDYALGQADAAGLESYARMFDLIGINMKEFLTLTKDEKALVLLDALSEAPDHIRTLAGQTLLGGRVTKDMAAVLNMSKEQRMNILKESQALGRLKKEHTDLGARYKDNELAIERIKELLKSDIFAPFVEQAVKAQDAVIKWWKAASDEEKAKIVKGAIMGIKALMALVVVGLGAALVVAAPFLLIMAKVALVITGIGVLASGVYVIFRDWNDIVEELTTGLSNLWQSLKDGARNFGGKVLELVGLGDDDSMAQAAAAGPSTYSGTTNNNTTINNYSVAGSNMVEKKIRENEAAGRRGNRR